MLEQLCRRVEHVGAVGAGASMKLAINLPLLVYYQALGEALSLCRSLDIEPARLIDIFADTSGGPNMLKVRGAAIAARCGARSTTPVTFDVDLIRKDLRTMLEEAAGLGLELPLAARALDCYDAAARQGLGTSDATMLPGALAAHGRSLGRRRAVRCARRPAALTCKRRVYGGSRSGRHHWSRHHGIGDGGQPRERRILHIRLRPFGAAPQRTRQDRRPSGTKRTRSRQAHTRSSSLRCPRRGPCSRSPLSLPATKHPGQIVVETSTLPIATKQQARRLLAARAITLLDCPLSGTGAQARTKDLAVYASGPRRAYRRCVPIFEGFSRAHFFLGPFGAGSKMKFLANLLVAIHNVAAAEALVLGMKAGLDPASDAQSAGRGRRYLPHAADSRPDDGS